MQPSDPSDLLDRLREIGPLGERFEQAARRALERAGTLPEAERRRLQAAVLAAAARDTERLQLMAVLRDSLSSLTSLLGEASAQLREAASRASVSLERMKELRRRLALLRSQSPAGRRG